MRNKMSNLVSVLLQMRDWQKMSDSGFDRSKNLITRILLQ